MATKRASTVIGQSPASRLVVDNPQINHAFNDVYDKLNQLNLLLVEAQDSVKSIKVSQPQDLPAQASFTSEVPAGLIDGANQNFRLKNVPKFGLLIVVVTGVVMQPLVAYTVVKNGITFATAPLITDWIQVWYSY